MYLPIEFQVVNGVGSGSPYVVTSYDTLDLGWDANTANYDFDVYYRGTSRPTPNEFGIDNGAQDYGGDVKAIASDADAD